MGEQYKFFDDQLNIPSHIEQLMPDEVKLVEEIIKEDEKSFNFEQDLREKEGKKRDSYVIGMDLLFNVVPKIARLRRVSLADNESGEFKKIVQQIKNTFKNYNLSRIVRVRLLGEAEEQTPQKPIIKRNNDDNDNSKKRPPWGPGAGAPDEAL